MKNEDSLSHALYAVLFAAKKNGCDLDLLLGDVRSGILSNNLRPLPQDQDAVIKIVETAIRDIN